MRISIIGDLCYFVRHCQINDTCCVLDFRSQIHSECTENSSRQEISVNTMQMCGPHAFFFFVNSNQPYLLYLAYFNLNPQGSMNTSWVNSHLSYLFPDKQKPNFVNLKFPSKHFISGQPSSSTSSTRTKQKTNSLFRQKQRD